MTTKELQTELENRAKNIKERAAGQKWGDKEIAFLREVYKYTVEHEKKEKENGVLRMKLQKLHELVTMYSKAFTLLSGCTDLPVRTDEPTPIGALVLMRLTSLTPESTEITTLKRFIYNAFNPARFIPRTKFGTFQPEKYRDSNALEKLKNYAKNEG